MQHDQFWYRPEHLFCLACLAHSSALRHQAGKGKRHSHNQSEQRAKKVVSDSPGLVDFAIGLVNSVFNLPHGQLIFFEEFEKQKNCEINSALQKAFGLVEMTSGLVNVSFSLPEWQAVKMIFFATCRELFCPSVINRDLKIRGR